MPSPLSDDPAQRKLEWRWPKLDRDTVAQSGKTLTDMCDADDLEIVNEYEDGANELRAEIRYLQAELAGILEELRALKQEKTRRVAEIVRLVDRAAGM